MSCVNGCCERFVASRLNGLNCIDPSAAIDCAFKKLTSFANVDFQKASIYSNVLPLDSQDLGNSQGVLDHVSGTTAANGSCEEPLKPGAPLIRYFCCTCDNRPAKFCAIWRLSEIGRRLILHLPPKLKQTATDLMTAIVYWPYARISGLLERFPISVHSIPLSCHVKHIFYATRTNARDCFCTPLNKHFPRLQIAYRMANDGLIEVRLSQRAPYWCAVGIKG